MVCSMRPSRLQAKFSQIYLDIHVLLKVEHMKLLQDSIEEQSAFDFRRMMRNWYMNMAPWDRPRECEPWLPDFLGDKKFFGEVRFIFMLNNPWSN